MDGILLAARVALAGIFLLSGFAKLVDRKGVREMVRDFGVPAPLTPPVAAVLPLAELAVAIAVIPTATAFVASLGALVLLLGFTAGIGVNLALGRTPDCHCFGALSRKPISVLSLVRNAGFLLIAGFVAVEAPSHNGGLELTNWLASLGAAETVGLVVAIVGLGLITFQWVFLFNLMTQNGRLISRLESLESQGGRVANDLVMGLPVGIPAPRFDLPDLFGDIVSIESLIAHGRPVFLLFTHPDCGPCKVLMPEVAQWQRGRWQDMTIALISRGSVEENKEKADEHGLIRVLLQKNNEVAEDYQSPGTPTAVLVNDDGRVGSALAVGAEAIRVLVDNVGRESRPTASPASPSTIELQDSAPRPAAVPQNGASIHEAVTADSSN